MQYRCFAFVLATAACVQAAEIRFNRDVRPILSDRCYACHGPDRNNRKTKMRLDIEADAKADLGKGRFAIVPGDPESSDLYKRITDKSPAKRMPPAYLGHEALHENEIAVLRQWIEQGAKYEQHWSFIPPVKAAEPAVSDKAWVRNPIDAFILSRLDREGLKPSAEADRRTLIRRVTLDLTGLPPTPAEVASFVQDQSPNAYEKLVDRLLASPAYGERMAIRWLEAARYADTNGYQTDGPRTMWRWRDWVVDAFNHNKSYDQFTIEQLAGDLLPNPTLEQKIATGFQRNHRTSAEGGIINEELRVEYVADRAETTATVWMGLTVGCARCHDHKFDPILQKDYYSLYAFYNNVPERGFVWNFGNEDPVMLAPLPDQQKHLAELDRNVVKASQNLRDLEALIADQQRRWERQIAKAPVDNWTVTESRRISVPEKQHFDGKTFTTLAAEPKLNYTDPFTFTAWINPDSPDGAILSKGEDYSEGQQHGLYLMNGKLRLHVTFRWTDLAMRLETVNPVKLHEWQHVAVSYDGSRKASGVRVYVNGELQEVNVILDQLLWPIDTKEPWRIGAGGGKRFTGSMSDVRVYTRALRSDEVEAISVQEPVNQLAAGTRSRAAQSKLRLCFLEKYATSDIRDAIAAVAEAQARKDKYAATLPTTMVMKERPDVRESFVLKRGAYDAPGEKVTPAVPAVLPQLPAGVPANRLGLAKWLVDRKNPLTARATVNRWWAMLFGIGLVKTVEDFGSQGEWPGNQDLLDWLAVEFMDSGWDVKHMLKTMVMSSAYRQSSKVTPALVQRDPENRLLARGPRFRLSAEMIRDQALAVSGLIVSKLGGPPVYPYQPPGLWKELTSGKEYEEDKGEGLYRRSLYTYWRRTIAPPLMINFDSPTRETCVVRESRTNTPLQALNLMNDVTFVEAARKLAERMMSNGGVAYGFGLVLSRPPTEKEQKTLESTLAKFRTFYQTNPNEADSLLSQGRSALRPELAKTDLAAYTGVASLILNLDEAVTKE